MQVDEKKNGFLNLTMGAEDGTEACVLVRTFLLNKISV